MGDDDDLVVRNRSQRWGMTLGWLSETDLRGWWNDDAGLVSRICQEQISEVGDDAGLVVRNRSQKWGMMTTWSSKRRGRAMCASGMRVQRAVEKLSVLIISMLMILRA